MIYKDNNEKLLADVYPFVADRTRIAINETEKANPGYAGKVSEGKRSIAKQLEDWQQGRSADGRVTDKNKVITNAKPEDAPHVYALAVDVQWIAPNGKEAPDDDPIWKAWGKNAKSAGLAWGGDFRELFDGPHVEMPNWRNYRDWKNSPKAVASAGNARQVSWARFWWSMAGFVGLTLAINSWRDRK